MTEEVIIGGSKALGSGVASMKTTKVEVQITPQEIAAIALATEKTSSVVEEVKTPHEALTDAHVTALAGMDSYATDAAH